MIWCGLSFMFIQFWVDHQVAGTTLQQPEAYLALRPPRWVNVRGGRVILQHASLVGKTASPYKPPGLCGGPLPHHQVTFCLTPKSWGQVDVFL